MSLSLYSRYKQHLLFTVWDNDKFKSDDFLGEAELALSQVEINNQHTLVMKLLGKDGGRVFRKKRMMGRGKREVRRRRARGRRGVTRKRPCPLLKIRTEIGEPMIRANIGELMSRTKMAPWGKTKRKGRRRHNPQPQLPHPISQSSGKTLGMFFRMSFASHQIMLLPLPLPGIVEITCN